MSSNAPRIAAHAHRQNLAQRASSAMGGFARMAGGTNFRRRQCRNVLGIALRTDDVFDRPQARKFSSNFNVRVVELTELPHSPLIGQ